VWWLVSELGWMKTGVIGGDPHLAQSPPAKFSDCTSPSHPDLTPSKPPSPRKMLFMGVCRASQLDGLLVTLPDADNGGVDG
jgi:hypothetical protein